MPSTFVSDLERLIDQHPELNPTSITPIYLAEFLGACLSAFNTALEGAPSTSPPEA